MKFEFDPNKSASNKVKHGIDFEEAQLLWENTIVMTPVVDDRGEDRWAVFGLIDDKHWTAIITMRENATRIISVRHSRKKEEDYYDSKTQH